MDSTQRGFHEQFYRTTDGLRLYARAYRPDSMRDPDSVPVLCLPGLSRNSRDFHPLACWLSSPDRQTPRRVITLDYRGRGLSDRDSDKSRYQLPVETGDVVAACAAFGIERAHFIGTSRGGLILHLLAGLRPALVAGVVLNDIGPVVEIGGLLRIRDYLAPVPAPQSWQQAADRLRHIHGDTFPALCDADWQEMAFAVFRDIDGRIVPDFDPALVEPLATLNAETSIPDLWAPFEALKPFPLLLIRGEHSDILSRETAAQMLARHPRLQAVTARGQGHAPLLHLSPLKEQIAAFFDGFS